MTREEGIELIRHVFEYGAVISESGEMFNCTSIKGSCDECLWSKYNSNAPGGCAAKEREIYEVIPLHEIVSILKQINPEYFI